jgi:hypothetical protein
MSLINLQETSNKLKIRFDALTSDEREAQMLLYYYICNHKRYDLVGLFNTVDSFNVDSYKLIGLIKDDMNNRLRTIEEKERDQRFNNIATMIKFLVKRKLLKKDN